MQITHLDGLGPVTAVIRSIGVRHDGAHDSTTHRSPVRSLPTSII